MRPGPRIEKKLRIRLTIGAACTPFAASESKRRLNLRQESRNLAAGDGAGKAAQVAAAQSGSRLDQGGHGASIECTADAYAPHAGFTQLRQRYRFTGADEHVEGLGRHGCNDGADRIHVGQVGSVEHVGTDLREGGETPNGIV